MYAVGVGTVSRSRYRDSLKFNVLASVHHDVELLAVYGAQSIDYDVS